MRARSKDEAIATVRLKDAGKWNRGRVAEVAAWMRQTARLLVKSQDRLAPSFRARFFR